MSNNFKQSNKDYARKRAMKTLHTQYTCAHFSLKVF